MTQTQAQRPLAQAPGLIRLPGPIVRRILGAGVSIGPNVLVTIRGRKTGQPREQALALVSDGHRRWVVGAFGEVNWCRNVRANPEVQIQIGSQRERAVARELSVAEAEDFFARRLPLAVGRMELFGRLAVKMLTIAAPDIKRDPAAAARRRPVFELLTLSHSAPG